MASIGGSGRSALRRERGGRFRAKKWAPRAHARCWSLDRFASLSARGLHLGLRLGGPQSESMPTRVEEFASNSSRRGPRTPSSSSSTRSPPAASCSCTPSDPALPDRPLGLDLALARGQPESPRAGRSQVGSLDVATVGETDPGLSLAGFPAAARPAGVCPRTPGQLAEHFTKGLTEPARLPAGARPLLLAVAVSLIPCQGPRSTRRARARVRWSRRPMARCRAPRRGRAGPLPLGSQQHHTRDQGSTQTPSDHQ